MADKFSRIYVDIQSLLDLRLGALLKVVEDKEKLAEYINSDEYNYRGKDVFSICPNETYASIKDTKDLSLISGSVVTYILTVIRSKINNLEKRNTYFGETRAPEVVLNIYPFELTEEQTEHLRNMFFIKLETECNIKIVSMPTSELTPLFLKGNNFIACFIYSFREWGDANIKLLEVTKLTDIVLYFPSIGEGEISKEDLNNLTKLGYKDVFSYTEFLLASVAAVSFLPIVFYSNMVTAIAHLSKFDEVLKNRKLESEEVDQSALNEILKKGGFDGDSSPAV